MLSYDLATHVHLEIPSKPSTPRTRALSRRYACILLVELYVLFSTSAISNSISLMICRQGPSVTTAAAFPQLECYSKRWLRLIPCAIAATASWAGLYIILLGWAVRIIVVERRKTRGASRGAFGFVTKDFQDTTYFQVIIVSLKDLLLVMSPAIFSDAVTSMTLGGLLYVAYSSLTMIALPYTDNSRARLTSNTHEQDSIS